jgi:lysozyme
MDVSLLKRDLAWDEGVRLKPYRCTAGRLTIGVGRNLDDVGITAEEADYLLENDLGRATADLDRALPWWRGLSEARQRALANMAFNMGLGRLLGFKAMLAALRAGRWEEAAAEALDSAWAQQVGPRAARIAATIREG